MHTEEENAKNKQIVINMPSWLRMPARPKFPKFGQLELEHLIGGAVTGFIFICVVWFIGQEYRKSYPVQTKIVYVENQDSVRAAKHAAPAANDFYNISVVLTKSERLEELGWTETDIAAAADAVNNYIETFGPVAISEMNKYGIPASIKLAQGLLESDAGNSRLCQKNNNHFGIKCFSKECKKGHCHNFSDDTHKDFFRAYGKAWESWRAHSLFLKNKRYKPLFKLDADDYKGWAEGLKKCGYATDEGYPQKITTIIEKLGLDEYDKP